MSPLAEIETALEDSCQLLSKEPYVDIAWRRRITALIGRVRDLEADNERLQEQLRLANIDAFNESADNERLHRTLREIVEEWAGAECGEPVHAQEAYAIALAKRMYLLAADALRGEQEK